MPKIERWWRPIAVAATVLCVSLSHEAEAIYDVQPGKASGRPGSIIRVWPLEGGGPSGANSTAFRILYRSTGLNGEPIVRRHLHPTWPGAGRRTQRDRLGASDKRGDRILRAFADA
jgi:hypothetical protein